MTDNIQNINALATSYRKEIEAYEAAKKAQNAAIVKAAWHRLQIRASEYHAELKQKLLKVLPPNASPAETLLIAHLVTARDAFEDVSFRSAWQDRPTAGTGTTIVYQAEVASDLVATFGCEVRNNGHTRQLAILLDEVSPGERSPEKMERERLLSGLGFRIMVFTDVEVVAAADLCRTRVENLLAELNGDVDMDAWNCEPKRDNIG